MGARAGSHAATWAAEAPAPDQHAEAQDLEQGRVRALTAAAGPTRPVQFRRAVQQAMAPVMIAKDEGGLAAAEQALAEVEAGLASRVRLGSRADLFEAVGVGNLALVAWLVARAARLRRESRGAHYRADYPEEGGEAYAQRLIWRLEDEQCVVSWEERMT
jgi:succinate dehydrogenase/fumarate reductase flavoprotein subunit